MQNEGNIGSKKRILITRNVCFALLAFLIFVLLYRMIYKGEDYQKMAIEQQTNDSNIAAKRGTIFDRNGKALAVSASTVQITADPETIREKKTAKKTASELSSILDIEYEEIYDKLKVDGRYALIARQVDKEIGQKVSELKLPGIAVMEDSKRYYPYGAFASQVIGFTGTDNQGLDGIEMEYDEQLKGIPGRIVSASSANGTEVPYKYEQYIEAKDGYNVTLTIDEVIQHYVEKYLKKAYKEHKLANGGAAIVMNPNTGEILAMASVPDYDLNEPFKLTKELKSELKGISDDEEKKQKESDLLFKMWRNKAVSDSYEPGSTFKLSTASAALESGVCKLDDRFFCSGVFQVADATIHCWNTNGHGSESFVETVCNSCNPGFIQIGQKIGSERFYQFSKLFGFMDKTGIELPGETNGVYHNKDGFNEVQLATASFGQGIQITPLQLITFVSSIANGGKLMVPHVVKKITDIEGDVISATNPVVQRTVMSSETAENMRNIMKQAVESGAATNAYIAGFRVGGKTGTSEKLPRGNGKYIASFVGIAPVDNPQIAVIVMLDEPDSFSYYGNALAAPVAREIIDDTLQYLGVEAQYSSKETISDAVTVPSVTGLSLKNAMNTAEDAGFDYAIVGDGDKVEAQVPAANSSTSNGATIILYTTGSTDEKVIVPDVLGMTPEQAQYNLNITGLNYTFSDIAPNLKDYITASSQSPEAGEEVAIGTTVTVNFIQEAVD